MRFSVYQSQLTKAFTQRNAYLSLAAGLLLLTLILSVSLFSVIGRERIVVIPASTGEFWVDKNNVSASYLAQMGRFFSAMYLTVSPATSREQREVLLKYTDPSFYSELSSLLTALDEKLQKQHISTVFYIADVKVDTKSFTAVVSGNLKTTIGKITLPEKPQRYQLQFNYRNGRLLIKNFQLFKEESNV